jgi:hypothetical protein
MAHFPEVCRKCKAGVPCHRAAAAGAALRREVAADARDDRAAARYATERQALLDAGVKPWWPPRRPGETDVAWLYALTVATQARQANLDGAARTAAYDRKVNRGR